MVNIHGADGTREAVKGCLPLSPFGDLILLLPLPKNGPLKKCPLSFLLFFLLCPKLRRIHSAATAWKHRRAIMMTFLHPFLFLSFSEINLAGFQRSQKLEKSSWQIASFHNLVLFTWDDNRRILISWNKSTSSTKRKVDFSKAFDPWKGD